MSIQRLHKNGHHISIKKYDAKYMKLGRCPHILYTALALTLIYFRYKFAVAKRVHFWYVDAAGNHF